MKCPICEKRESDTIFEDLRVCKKCKDEELKMLSADHKKNELTSGLL